jgi:hypothetical protein
MTLENNKLFYIGKFGETVQAPKGSDEYIKEAEMFSIGTHRGVEYTEGDLEELVNNFKAEEEIPVQIDHSESARDTVGYLQEASVKDGKLMGKVKIIDKFAQERIDQGLMKKLSISFYLKFTEEGIKPHKIREVSLVAFPQVKGAKLFSENGYVSNITEKEDEGMTEQELAKFKEDLRKQVKDELQADYKEVLEKAEQFDEVQVKFKESQVASKIEKFQAESKVIPAQADALQKLLLSFSEEQAQAFDEFMSNSKTADFKEEGEVENQDEKDERSQEQKDFDAFYEQHAKKYGTSL